MTPSQRTRRRSAGTAVKIVVIGPFAAGKTTLIRTINRLEAIDSGTITVDGQDIHRPGIDINSPARV